VCVYVGMAGGPAHWRAHVGACLCVCVRVYRITSCKQCLGRVKSTLKEQGLGYARFLAFEDLFAYTMVRTHPSEP
jgi:hypothetical protein